MTDTNDEVAELKAKIVTLEERNVRLMEDLQNAETEKRYSESELFRLQKDISRLRNEREAQEPAAHHRRRQGRPARQPRCRQELHGTRLRRVGLRVRA